MSAPQLNNTTPITQNGDLPHLDMLVYIGMLVKYIDALETRIAALEALHP